MSSSGVFNTMADQYADADDIQSVFATAAEALTGLERTGISRQIALVGVQQLVQGRLDDDLLAIARGFQSQAVAEAQTQMMGLDITVLHPSDEALLQNETAQALLANIEAAVLKELNDRLPRKGVEAQLGAALAGLRSGDSALVGDAVHAAFDSAAPLEKAGAREAARGSRDVDDLVLDKLRELREDELKDLLQHVQPADLTRLKAAARAQAQAHEKEPHKNLLPNSAQLAKAVDQEFASRTAVVVEPFRADAAFFCSRHKNEEHHSLPGDDLKSLVGLARDLEQVKAHCRLYGIDLPQEIWQLKDSPYQPASHLSDLVFLLGGIAAAAFKPPQGVKPEDLEPQMLMDVSNALRSLRLLDPLIGYNLGETLFRAQETRLQERRETLQAMVQEYISSCSSEQESQALGALAELEKASREFQEMHVAFGRGTVAAARDADTAILEAQSRNLEQHRSFAADNLSTEAQTALRETFGLVIPTYADAHLLRPGAAGDSASDHYESSDEESYGVRSTEVGEKSRSVSVSSSQSSTEEISRE